jgi:hypothetical protein
MTYNNASAAIRNGFHVGCAARAVLQTVVATLAEMQGQLLEQPVRIADECCGAFMGGSMAIGLARYLAVHSELRYLLHKDVQQALSVFAPGEVVLGHASEKDDAIRRAVMKQHPAPSVISSDVRSAARRHRWINVGQIVTLGFPCQGFSQANYNGGAKDPSASMDLVLQSLEPLAEVSAFDRVTMAQLPLLFILENVAGLVTHHPA